MKQKTRVTCRLILKYEKLDKYVEYDEFIKNELSSIV